MAKARTTTFYCKECGYESAKWLGQCPGCHEWNSFVEAPVAPKNPSSRAVVEKTLSETLPIRMSEVDLTAEERFTSGFGELDRVLGGGIVQGSLVLVGGDPGIGKSTILLQVCRNVAASRKILYVSGEESARQIKMRANRIGSIPESFLLLCETNLARVRAAIEQEKPEVVVIDSVQTMFSDTCESAPGSMGQVRECTNILMQLAKGLGVTIFVIGHVTKDGTVAGPRTLEHMVDTVLYFEGERSESYRVIRAVKNRFGATNEIGVFEMSEDGLREVLNPSEYLLSGRPENAHGSVVACLMEGTRPIMVEVQALVTESHFENPRRTVVGADYNRVTMLLAVLEKYWHYTPRQQKDGRNMYLGSCDIYINVVGGMKVNEPALDLAIIQAVKSSYLEQPFPDQTVVFGEVGLSGEVRAVSQARSRVAEAEKLGFKKCYLPQANADGDLKSKKKPSTMNLIGIKSVST